MAELPTPEALAALPEDDLLASIEATKRRIAELGSLLDAYLDDLTRRADAGEIDPQTGRYVFRRGPLRHRSATS